MMSVELTFLLHVKEGDHFLTVNGHGTPIVLTCSRISEAGLDGARLLYTRQRFNYRVTVDDSRTVLVVKT